ncbi:MAG: hypothetical protein AAGB51_14405 [Planctomycetota bacterium]
MLHELDYLGLDYVSAEVDGWWYLATLPIESRSISARIRADWMALLKQFERGRSGQYLAWWYGDWERVFYDLHPDVDRLVGRWSSELESSSLRARTLDQAIVGKLLSLEFPQPDIWSEWHDSNQIWRPYTEADHRAAWTIAQEQHIWSELSDHCSMLFLERVSRDAAKRILPKGVPDEFVGRIATELRSGLSAPELEQLGLPPLQPGEIDVYDVVADDIITEVDAQDDF